jgi:hypothetical protein
MPHPHLISQLIRRKDDVTVILHLGISFMPPIIGPFYSPVGLNGALYTVYLISEKLVSLSSKHRINK